MLKLLKNSNFWFAIILLIGAGLRFYNLSGYLQFLGDQGRDVLIVKRMIVDGKWTLLGPNASVGGFFTGPIYYYFMLPFLWMSKLDPVGPAVLAAIIGTGTIALIFYFCKLFFNSRTAIIAAFLVALSPKMVDISRFSWNPNPVPFFALLTIVLLYLASLKYTKLYNFLAGITLGILFQLHYINLVFVPIVGLSLLLIHPWRQWLINGVMIAAGFLLGDSLFLIFEIRHGFPNLRSVWEFVNRGGQTVSPRSTNFIGLFVDMGRRLFVMLFSLSDQPAILFFVLSIFGTVWWGIKNRISDSRFKVKATLLAVWLIVGLFGIGSYKGTLYDHYFGYLYPLPFILLAITFNQIFQMELFGVIVAALGICVLAYFSITHLYLWQPPNNMLDQVREIDRVVLAYSDGQPYNLGLISTYNSDFGYRYFLEIWGKPPVTIENPQIDPARKTPTGHLIVICESKKCEPLGNPVWEIAGFGRADIVTQTSGPAGITIFKLVHYTGK